MSTCPTPSATLPELHVANAHFVTPFLAVGGDLPFDDDLAREHADELVAAGVTHVLDVRHEADDAWFWGQVPGVTYRWDGIDDAGQVVPAAWFEDVVAWALAALEAPGARLLVHCHMGINRGPSVGFAVLLASGWDPVAAIAAIRRARPIAHVWYAEDALRWHHWRTGASPSQQHSDVQGLKRWREDHPLDVVRIIRKAREAEQRPLQGRPGLPTQPSP